jgi:hypothetical protein
LDTGDLSSYFGRKEGQLIPRQQVSAESETDDYEEQHGAADPGDFARRVIGAQEENAEHMNEQRRNHQVGRPAMNPSNQPAKLNFGDDELNALESVSELAGSKAAGEFRWRPAQQTVQRHAAEVILSANGGARDFFLSAIARSEGSTDAHQARVLGCLLIAQKLFSFII